METALHLTAILATAAGTACLYLGSPRQQWLPCPWPARPARGGGAAFLAVSWAVWAAILHPATAFFAMLTAAMILSMVAPATILVRRRT